jgi:hypothetical protein
VSLQQDGRYSLRDRKVDGRIIVLISYFLNPKIYVNNNDKSHKYLMENTHYIHYKWQAARTVRKIIGVSSEKKLKSVISLFSVCRIIM